MLKIINKNTFTKNRSFYKTVLSDKFKNKIGFVWNKSYTIAEQRSFYRTRLQEFDLKGNLLYRESFFHSVISHLRRDVFDKVNDTSTSNYFIIDVKKVKKPKTTQAKKPVTKVAVKKATKKPVVKSKSKTKKVK